MRSSLLDIKVTSNRETPQPATVIRVHIQTRNRDRGRQRHRQLQLCVPLVAFIEDAYRRAVTATINELTVEETP
jgi:hypothetical protein